MSETRNPADETARKAAVPTFRHLTLAALYWNLPLVALFLMTGRLAAALSVLGGYLLGLLATSMLYAIVTGDFLMNAFGPSASRGGSGGHSMGFVLLALGKFVLVGAVIVLLLRVFHCNPLMMVAGLFLTQVAVSVATWRHLKKTKVTD